MAQLMNQFTQTPEKGLLDLRFNPSVLSARVGAAQATALVPGQPVTIVDNTSEVPEVIAASGITSDVFGFVVYDVKSAEYAAGEMLEVAFGSGTVMYMLSDAAFARYAELMIVISGVEVATAAGAGTKIIGRALDKASGAGELVRVLINLPAGEIPA